MSVYTTRRIMRVFYKRIAQVDQTLYEAIWEHKEGFFARYDMLFLIHEVPKDQPKPK